MTRNRVILAISILLSSAAALHADMVDVRSKIGSVAGNRQFSVRQVNTGRAIFNSALNRGDFATAQAVVDYFANTVESKSAPSTAKLAVGGMARRLQSAMNTIPVVSVPAVDVRAVRAAEELARQEVGRIVQLAAKAEQLQKAADVVGDVRAKEIKQLTADLATDVVNDELKKEATKMEALPESSPVKRSWMQAMYDNSGKLLAGTAAVAGLAAWYYGKPSASSSGGFGELGGLSNVAAEIEAKKNPGILLTKEDLALLKRVEQSSEKAANFKTNLERAQEWTDAVNRAEAEESSSRSRSAVDEYYSSPTDAEILIDRKDIIPSWGD